MPSTTVDARASVAHPLHQLLSAFPVALFTTALVTDIAYANTAYLQWQYFSIWLITGGLLTGGLAFVSGVIDRWRRPPARGSRLLGLIHGLLTVAAWVTALVNAFVHSRDGWTAVVPTGLILSVFTVVLLLAGAWLGARLTGESRA